MANYAVLGLGMMGSAICYDILSFDPTSKVFGLELDNNRREMVTKHFQQFNDRFQAFPLDLKIDTSDSKQYLTIFFRDHEINVAFGAIDYKYNLFLTNICIAAGVNFLDLGGNPTIVDLQKNLTHEAKDANITIIPDCGLAPGMVNIIAAQIMHKFEQLDECHIRVGGLPQKPKTILKYQQVFSIRGLTNEYLEDAIIIHNGQLTTVPSLTEIETLIFPEPWGTLEAFQTAGGTSSLPELFKGKIKELTYKTIRFPGHCQFFAFLKEYGFLSSDPYPLSPQINPREVIEYYLTKNLPKNDPDAVLIRITVSGIRQGKKETHIYQCIDLADSHTGLSAMARTTAFPISIIGQMIAHNIIKTRGVVPGELVVPEKEFLDALKKRQIIFAIKII